MVPYQIKGIEKDVEKDVDTILEDLYPDGREDLRKAKWYEYVYYFRWIVNFIVVGNPWFFTSLILIAVNLGLNILMNKFWAGGNILLIFNTTYLTI